MARLERAIRGRDEPGTRIITYGTNRIATYYPYLKLAEAHLLAGHLEAHARPCAVRPSEARSPPRRARPSRPRSRRRSALALPRPPSAAQLRTAAAHARADPDSHSDADPDRRSRHRSPPRSDHRAAVPPLTAPTPRPAAPVTAPPAPVPVVSLSGLTAPRP